MPRIIANEAEVLAALETLAVKVRDEGATLIYRQADLKAVCNAVNAEYACGADGSVYDVLVDLNDSIGLDEVGIFIEG